MQPAMSVKESLHQLAEQLPEGATWQDVAEEVRFRLGVEKGLQAADRGEFAAPEKVKATFERWGVNVNR